MKKITAVCLLILILIIPQLGCNTQVNNTGISKTSYHLNTICTVTVYSMNGLESLSEDEIQKEVLTLITDAFRLCDSYEKKLSKTIEGSDIYNINHAGGKAVKVSEETLEVVQKGIKYGELSEGAFDITIGKVTDLWNFQEMDDQGNHIGEIPDENAVSDAVSHVNYKNIVIEEDSIRLLDPQSEIDLGGIAKGYIADKVAEYLESEGVTSAIVDLGGNIVVIGEKGKDINTAEGTEFAVGIKDPQSENGGLLGLYMSKDKTIVTSGTYERYFEIDGKRYHHVLDSKTGHPIDTDLLSVTIIGEKGSSADCDGISTSCLALGKEKGLALVKQIPGIEAIFVDKDGTVTKSSEDVELVKG